MNTTCRMFMLFCSFGLGIQTGEVSSQQQTVFPDAEWQTKTPSELGLDRAKLDQFARNVGGVGVIVKDGYIVKSWGRQTSHGEWASATKPLIGTLLFFAIEEGKVSSVEDLIKDHGWDLSAEDQTMTFRHLANMTSGYARAEAPGEAWAYNDFAIQLYVRTVLQRVYGIRMNEAAEVADLVTDDSRLGPLQFQDGSLLTIKKGAPRINMTPRDFARLGWFWLHNGDWNGQQLLPRRYFDDYMRPLVPDDLPRTTGASRDYLGIDTYGGGSDQSPYGPGIYGFNWWFNAPSGTAGELAWPDAPSDLVMSNGHWNKELMVFSPSLNLVAAARGNWGTLAPGDTDSSMNQNLKLLTEAVVVPEPSTLLLLALGLMSIVSSTSCARRPIPR